MFNVRIFTILSFIVMIFLLIGSVSATDLNDTAILSAGDDEVVSMENNMEELSADSSTFSELAKEIGSGGNVTLTHEYYTYDKGSTIRITTANSVIDGKGAVIDMAGSTIGAFYAGASGVTFKNLTIMNVNYDSAGGAIGFYQSGTVTDCNFFNNNAYFGAVSFSHGYGEIINCNFVNNTAISRGGALFFGYGGGNITNCNFVNNSVKSTSYGGGAIYFEKNNGKIANCNFVNNSAPNLGGAIYFYDAEGTLLNCNFTNNVADDGGAVYGSVNLVNCNFVNNSASNLGGAVYGSGSLANCSFVNNSAKSKDGGGAIYMRSANVKNCNFTNNRASTGRGGAITFEDHGNITNCNFINNYADLVGGAVCYINSPDGTILNCNFVNNRAYISGGAVHFNNAEGNVSYCNFTNNTAGYYGGAVCFSNSGIVSNCNFNGNTAGDGGAVYFNQGTVLNCNFTGNTGSSRGGAVFFYLGGTVLNCNFTGNTAYARGGAVFFFDSATYTVTNSYFTNNTAHSGSAIFSYLSSSTISVKDSSFFNNRANSDDLTITESDGVVNIIFTGKNNLLNAIYSECDVSFDNVSYWGVNGSTNTDVSSFTRSNKEQGQNIIITINDNKILKEFTGVTGVNGNITFDLKAGFYKITAYHPGGSYYTATDVKQFNVTTGKISNLDLSLDDFTLTASVTSGATGNVTFKVDDWWGSVMKTTVDLSDSVAKLDLYDLPFHQYTVTAVYNGDSVYISSTNTIIFSLKMLASTVIVEAANITTAQKEVINITVNNKKDKVVFVYVNDDRYYISDGVLTLSDLDAGIYQVRALFSGDRHYESAVNSTFFEVVKCESAIGIDVESVYEVGEDIVITLTPVNSTGAVNVTINGKAYNVTDNKVTIAGGLVSSTYFVVAKLAGDNKFYASESNATFYVNKVTPFISADDLNFTIGSEGILDIYGPSDRNAILLVSVNGMYLVSILSNGSAKLDVSSLNVGSYEVDITYFENDKYADGIFTDVATVSVIASDVVISVDSGVRYYHYAEKFNATITDNGVGVPNKTVMFTINGVTYTKTTDDDGVASIAINLSPGNYTVGVEVPDYKFNDNVTLEVKHTVYAEDLVKFFRNGTQYYALFLDSNGNPLVNTDVIFNINGVFYYRTTNASGVARLNINLMAGDYIITAYNTVTGEQWSNNIKVLPTLYGDDLTKKYGTTTPYSVKLVDGTGKAMANEAITLNINGVLYTRMTDSEGVARLNINLMAGEYIITASYKGVNWSNKVTVTQ